MTILNTSRTQSSTVFPGFSHYTYGTTRLGDDSIPFEDRVRIARAAIDAGLGLHTSHTYGNALSVLRAAFDHSPPRTAPAIFKIGWDNVDQIRDVIQQNLEPLGLTHMAVGQLCLGGDLAEQFRRGGPGCEELRMLKTEGLVGRFVLEIWPWNSDVAVDGIKGGHADGLIDGYIFYCNPLQRFASDELWDLLLDQKLPILAMRTVCGGSAERLAQSGPDYLKSRATQILPVYARSGCATWTEFCVRFVFGIPNVCTTVGATSHLDNLHELINAAEALAALPQDIQSEILALHHRWAADHDRHAAPWSM